ncbi:MAG: M15 family metallopeptidase [Bacteroidetes bacterium]|nr:M15 family metallopeptidase [Bacteroidota bacterium]MBU1114122.1 M15 family metallopeptidase [Bacteroidota bacterium]MBU1800538.1 M15 family metallopeptidase [Bacteroidota bacterium]
MKLIKFTIFQFLIAFSFLHAQSDTLIVPLWSIDSTIVTDVKYATTDNFTGKILYPTDKVYIRKMVGEALSKVHSNLLKTSNYRIKIFDGYRPLSVQKKMWEILPDDRYVANPASGSRHNRGAAVDVTIIDSSGTELDMGTEYDNFTERAHYAYPDLPENVKANRALLRNTMAKYGFNPINTEWWHFDFSGWEGFSILDFEIK